MLIDSDVLIWLIRGHVGAAQRLGQISTWRISVVTYMELAQGCRDKAELARLKKGLAARNTDVLQVTPAISQCAAELVDLLALSHGMRLADALIGATAIEHGATLITANTRHFEAVQNLVIEGMNPLASARCPEWAPMPCSDCRVPESSLLPGQAPVRDRVGSRS